MSEPIKEAAVNKHTPRQPIYQPETDTYLIPLTQGYHAVVDACDVDLAEFNWFAKIDKYGVVYAKRNIPIGIRKQSSVLMHRVIMARILDRELQSGEEVDHTRGGGLINTRENLRLADRNQNTANRKINRNSTTGFKGVTYIPRLNKWAAQIRVRGTQMYLGVFTTPEAAHAAYVTAAREHFGEFANEGED
jgi:hypothetical protein